MNKWLYEFDAKNVIKKDDGADNALDRKFGQSDLKKSNTES